MPPESIVDAAAGDRVLVFGSLPPEGRDLDLLVRPPEQAALAEALTRDGFESHHGEWVRFRGCSVDVVELVPAEAWQLPHAEVDALFRDAQPVDGLDRLVRPAPHHMLLILARRIAGGDGRLDAKRRARLDAALSDRGPGCWEEAGRRAPAWGAVQALEQLRRVHASGIPAPRRARARAVAEQASRAGAGGVLARLRGWRRHIPRRRRGWVIALSGLDGAGKSSQAQALCDTLDRLGYDSSTAWTRITHEGWIWGLAFPLKRALNPALALLGPNRRRREDGTAEAPLGAGEASPGVAEAPPGGGEASPGVAEAPPGGGEGEPPGADPVRRIRQRSRPLTELWAGVIALANGISQRRLTRPELRRGRVVVCDRYTLDSVVALRFLYGENHRFAGQRRLIELLSPRPRRAYLLDVSPDTAYSRKGEHELDALARQAALYRQEHESLGVTRLDGERPAEELCAEIARDVWLALR